MENTLFSKLQQFMNGEQVKLEGRVIEIFHRANIVPVGQVQVEGRSIIKASDRGVGKDVYRPLTEQRPLNLVQLLGIKYIDGLSANFQYPLIDGNNGAWVGECEAPENLDNVTFSSVTLSPRRLLHYVELGKEVILNPYTDLQSAVEQDIIESVWAKVQGTLFKELWDSNNESESGTVYNLEDFEDIIAFELAGKDINFPVYLVSPAAAAKLKGMNSTVFPVMYNRQINGFPVIETPYLDGEKIIFGDFSRLLLGQFGGFDITVDNVTKANVGVIRLICNTYWDWGMLDKNSFLFASTEAPESNNSGD